MRRKILLLALIVGLIVPGCAGKELRSEPEWVDGSSARYPDRDFLVGRGRAKNLEDAQNRARADLAKVFEVSILDQRSDEQRFLMGTGPDGESRQSELQVTRSLVTHTEQVVRGVRIAEIWREPLSGEHHALAILARTQAAAALRAEIRRLDEAAGIEIGRAREEGDRLRQIAAARRALENQVERAGLQRALQVVDHSGLGVPPKWQLARLRSDLEELLARLRIDPAATAPEALETALASGIAAAGFTVGGGPGSYPLRAELDLADPELQDGWYWQRGTLVVTLYDPAGAVRGNQRWPIKESARDRATARQRAIDTAAATLQRDLLGVLLGFAVGEER